MHNAALRYIDAVARFGSIRRASEELNISASAINRQIIKLEEQFGVELFERRANGLKPTVHGILVIEHARRTLHDFEAVRSEVGESLGTLTGLVRIATLDSITVHILPRAIISFRKRHPGVTFRIETADPTGVTRLVSNDSADIGLTFENAAQPGIAVLHQVPAPLCVVMHRTHPLSGRARLSVFDCLTSDIILQEDTGPVTPLLGDEIASVKQSSAPILVTNTIVASKGLILRGAGLGFFTRFGFIQELEVGTVVAVPLEERRPSTLKLATIVSSGRRTTRAIDMFVEELHGVLDAEVRQTGKPE
ncbi:MAG: LysR family transcriptional regulator [Hyphomicrobiales bacterium]|nr:LysR family transcriptional regulator [Hyphomicrobiales bacterium]